jgi:FlgD Ig-like domain/Fungalysin metallopeptidase (M36)
MPPTRYRNLLAAAASLALVCALAAPELAEAKREGEPAPEPAARASSSEPRALRTTLPGAWKADVDAATGRVLTAWRHIPALLLDAAPEAPRAASNGDASSATGEPDFVAVSRARATVASARRVLNEWAPRLQLDEGLANLVLKYERHGLARDVFVFQQMIDDIPVLGGEIGVTLWNDEPIMIFSGGYVPQMPVSGGASGASASSAGGGAALRSSAPSIGSGDAEARVRFELLSRFGLTSLVDLRTHESPSPAPLAREGRSTLTPPSLIWYRTSDDALALGYLVRLPLDSPRGDWAGIVDAVSGEVVHLADDARYATATGRVFHPNPVVTLQNITLRDLDDADQAALNGAYVTVTLRDVELSQGTYKLRGPYVEVVDLSQPSIDPPEPTDSLFFFTRSQEEFEAVNGYYHVDRAQRYIQSLGFTGERSVAAIRLKIDVHALDNTDNSLYTPSQKSIQFGDGCVDDAEDADVIYHEYGHAIQDDQVDGWGFIGQGLTPARSLGEGFGDYWSSSMASQIGGGFDEAQVFDWDRNPGSPCWAGRRVDANFTMADYSQTDIYKNGMIWSRALWDIRAATGAAIADRLVIESHFGLDPNTTFEQNATSLAMADVTLYGGAHIPSILDAFADRGIEVDTTGLGPDSLAPSLTIAVLQNPLLGNYLDVVVHGSEPLALASLEGTLGGTALQFEQQDGAGRIFRAERRISAAGSFPIEVSAADFAGNDTTVTRGFTAAITSGQVGTTVASFDGVLAVRFETGALPGGTWVIVSDGMRAASSEADHAATAPSGAPAGAVDLALSEIAYEIAASGRALSSPAHLTLVRSPFGGSTENLSIALGDGGRELPASFDASTGSLSASLPALGTIVVGVAPDAGDRAPLASLRLGPVSPNPSTGDTRVVIEAAAPQAASLAVYSAAGRLVRTLFQGRARAGLSEIVWDGRDGAGRAVPSGVYFFRMDGERGSASRKVVIAR